MSNREITQLLADMWRDMDLDTKQKYTSRMHEKRRKYAEEFAAYRKTASYREHQKKLVQFRSRRPESDLDSKDETGKWAASLCGTDIPVFSGAFLRHNRDREAKLRLTRTQLAAVDSQRHALARRQAALRAAADALSSDAHRLGARAARTRYKTKMLSATVLKAVQGIALPGSNGEKATAANLTKWLKSAEKAAAQNAAFDKVLRAAMGKVKQTG